MVEELLIKGKALCSIARKYALYYQTILKWLWGFASKRETKAICFARHGPFFGLNDLHDREYARQLWIILKKAFTDNTGGVMTAAGGLLWEKYGCTLF